MHDATLSLSAEARIAALERRLAALEQRMGLTAAPAAAGETATADALDALARRHCDRPFAELLEVINLEPSAVLGGDMTQACEKLFDFIVGCHLPVMTYGGQVREARNGSLYLSLDFGFGRVSVFNDTARVFAQTPYLMLGSFEPDQSHDFNPPLVGVLERDRRGYPRIMRLTLPDPIAWNIDDVSVFNDAQEIEF